jgi:hypothetical protein
MKRVLAFTIVAFLLLGGASAFAQPTPPAPSTAGQPQAKPQTASSEQPAPMNVEQLLNKNPAGLFWGVTAFVVVGGLLIGLGSVTDILRDSQPQDFGPALPKKYRRTFSLAQTQMAWWFCVILASYIYIVCANPTAANFPNFVIPSVLVLMGIGSGTALGATMIEQVKGNQNNANLANPPPETTIDTFNDVVSQLEIATAAAIAANLAAAVAAAAVPPNQVLVTSTAATAVSAQATVAALTAQRNLLAPRVASTDFFTDILTDVNGISLHRFQAFVWTFVLGIVFVTDVIMTTTMPKFDGTLLALLGISNGAYLGFKVPETPS